MKRTPRFLLIMAFASIVLLPSMVIVSSADPLPGGTLDPTAVPKFVIPLVIPPVMKNDGAANSYDIAVRQFKQQILPGGIWNQLNGRADNYSPTQIWSYGPAGDPTPVVAPDPASQFNYPAYTIETTSGTRVNVRWINDLKDPQTGQFLPHLLPVDQTLHWANPPQQCADGSVSTDCAGTNPEHYVGPVPMSVHVHGSHVDPHSDGFPEAWVIDVNETFALFGVLYGTEEYPNHIILISAYAQFLGGAELRDRSGGVAEQRRRGLDLRGHLLDHGLRGLLGARDGLLGRRRSGLSCRHRRRSPAAAGSCRGGNPTAGGHDRSALDTGHRPRRADPRRRPPLGDRPGCGPLGRDRRGGRVRQHGSGRSPGHKDGAVSRPRSPTAG